MAGRDLYFALMLLAALGLALRCWVLERRLERRRRQLAEQDQLMQAVVERLRLGEGRGEAKAATGSDAFASDLVQADIKQRLKGGEPPKKIPERYRLVAAMARRGLAAADIAEILEIAPGEAEQLIKLAKVSGER
jgi:AraC-like DNA-binding protein